jgi:tRNA/tmRNA/rRNA uracil-C5-methylase (TrmA/RlmC/RlmD family)
VIRAGQNLELTIDRVGPDGAGLASFEGGEVVVSGAFIGERVRVVVDHVGQHRRSFATVEALLTAHPGRRSPPCERHPGRGGECSGCAWQTLHEDAQRAEKRRLLAQVYGLEVDSIRALPGGDFGYRWSSKRVVGGVAGALVLGSYVSGSHRLADMTGCLVEHPAIAAAAHELLAVADELGTEPYRPDAGEGEPGSAGLRYVWLKTDGRSVLLTLITGAADARALRPLADRLELPSGVAWSVQSGQGNAIRGAAIELLRGEPSLSLRLAGREVEVGPLGFLQPNPAVAELAYRDLVRDHEGDALAGELALDLYAGAGVTTSLLRAGFARVVPVESYPESAHALGVVALGAAEFLAGYGGARPELVIANPPRAGLGAEVCARLVALAAPRLQIMSCSPRTLARDLAALEAGGYRRVALRAYDTLPQTPHVEVIAWLGRSPAAA